MGTISMINFTITDNEDGTSNLDCKIDATGLAMAKAASTLISCIAEKYGMSVDEVMGLLQVMLEFEDLEEKLEGLKEKLNEVNN